MLSLPEMRSQPLIRQELKELDPYLTPYTRLTLFHVHGLLCAITTGPRSVSGESWLSAILGETPKEISKLG